MQIIMRQAVQLIMFVQQGIHEANAVTYGAGALLLQLKMLQVECFVV